MWKFSDQSILGGADELHRQHAHSVQKCSVPSFDCLLPCPEQPCQQFAEMYVCLLFFVLKINFKISSASYPKSKLLAQIWHTAADHEKAQQSATCTGACGG